MAGASPAQPAGDLTQMFLECTTQLFSHVASQEGRRFADEWLQGFQLRAEAWAIVDKVLSTSQDGNALFLAAQTLNRKIRYDKAQLGNHEQTWESLRHTLVQHLFRHGNLAVVRTQLALALVALMVQMDSWVGGIQDVMRLFETNPMALLEVLQRLPEDLSDESLDASPARRYVVDGEMNRASPAVIERLVRYAQDFRGDDNIRSLILRCLTSWLIDTDVNPVDISRSQLLLLARESIVRAEAGAMHRDFEPGCDMIVEACHVFDMSHSVYDTALVEQLFTIGTDLGPAFRNAASKGSDEVAFGIARVFSHICECFNGPLLKTSPEVLGSFLQTCLDILGHPKVKTARRACIPILSLFDELRNSYTSEGDFDSKLTRMGIWIDQLPVRCLSRMVRPEDEIDEDDDDDDPDGGGDDFPDAEGGEDDEEYDESKLTELDRFRRDCGDILKEVMWVRDVTGSAGNFVVELEGFLMSAVSRPANEASRTVEGVLYAVKCMGRKLANQHGVVETAVVGLVQKCFEVISRFASTSIRLRRTACDLLLELADFCCRRFEHFGRRFIEFLVESLKADEGQSSMHAARTFRYVCAGPNVHFLIGELETLSNVLNPFDSALRNGPALDVLEGLVVLWSAASGNELQQLISRERLHLVFETWSAIPMFVISQSITECKRGGLNQAMSAIISTKTSSAFDQLAVLVRFSPSKAARAINTMRGAADDKPDAVALILERIWPSLGEFLILPDKVMESLCRFIKHSVRTFPDHVRNWCPAILQFIVQRYSSEPSCSLLYLAGVVFQAFFEDEVMRSHGQAVVESLLSVTFSRILSSAEAFVNQPDYVDDFFYLARRTVEFIPEIFGTETPVLDRLIGMAAEVGIKLHHREAFRSVAMFLVSALDLSLAIESGKVFSEGGNAWRERCVFAVKSAFSKHEVALIWACGDGLAGGLPSDRVDEPDSKDGNLSNLLFILFEYWGPHHFRKLLGDALQGQAHLSNEIRANFLERFEEAAVHSEAEFRVTCRDFHAVAMRRLRRISSNDNST